MKYLQPTIDVFREVVNSIPLEMKIISSVVNGNIHSIQVCNLKWAQPGFDITIGGNKYRIVAIQEPDIIMAEGSNAIITGWFNIYAPYFFHGTPIQQGIELEQIKKLENKVPMIYIEESFNEKIFSDEEEKLERNVRTNIWFLTKADYEKWLTDNTHIEALNPMHRLAEEFVAVLKNHTNNCHLRFDTESFEYDLENFNRFGVYVREKGQVTNKWSEKLAGWKMPINLDINKIPKCENECSDFTGESVQQGGGSSS